MDRVTVRAATAGEVPAVLNVIDGAALAVEFDDVQAAIDRGDVLVAVAGNAPSSRSDAGCVVGALVLDGEEIQAVAVRRRRRGQGIGTALVEAAADRRESLVAAFDAGVRPFWASLGFDIESITDTNRFSGRR